MSKDTEKPDNNPLATALRKSADIIAPVIDEGTVLRINVAMLNEDYDPPRRNTYTYTALFVNNKWYLTGVGSLLGREYANTAALLTALAAFQGSTIELATEFESIR